MAATATATGHAGVGEALLGLQAFDHFGLEGLACVGFNVHDLAAITGFCKGHGQTIATGTACTADAVGVVFRLHRQTEVEHVRDGGNVDAAGRYIGGHQNLHLTIAQGHQAAITQTLAQRTVQSHCRETVLLQVSGQAIALDLGARKYDRLIDRCITQPVDQHLALVLRVVGPVKALLDVVVLFRRRIDLDFLYR